MFAHCASSSVILKVLKYTKNLNNLTSTVIFFRSCRTSQKSKGFLEMCHSHSLHFFYYAIFFGTTLALFALFTDCITLKSEKIPSRFAFPQSPQQTLNSPNTV